MRNGAIFLLLLLAGTFFMPQPGRAGEMISIPGTGDSQQLLRQLAAAFSRDHPGIVIDIPDSIGTGAAASRRYWPDRCASPGSPGRPRRKSKKTGCITWFLPMHRWFSP